MRRAFLLYFLLGLAAACWLPLRAQGQSPSATETPTETATETPTETPTSTPTITPNTCGGLLDRYWVGDGGNWTDNTHWSCTSGGAGGASVPNTTNPCHFDGGSFTLAGQTVTNDALGGSIGCAGMDWTGALHAPTFDTAGGSMTIDGSLTYIAGMTLVVPGDLVLGDFAVAGAFTVTCAGHIPANNSFRVQGAAPGVTWTLLDDFAAAVTIELASGTLNTNGFSFGTVIEQISSITDTSSNPGDMTLTLGASPVYIDSSPYVDFSAGNIVVNPGTSTFFLAGGSVSGFALNGQSVYDITLETGTGTGIDLGGDLPMHNLTLGPDTTVTGEGYTLTVNSMTGNGTAGHSVTFNGQGGILQTSTQVAVDYYDVTNSDCEGVTPCYAGANGTVDVFSAAHNWLAQDAPTPTPTETPTATETPSDCTAGGDACPIFADCGGCLCASVLDCSSLPGSAVPCVDEVTCILAPTPGATTPTPTAGCSYGGCPLSAPCAAAIADSVCAGTGDCNCAPTPTPVGPTATGTGTSTPTETPPPTLGPSRCCACPNFGGSCLDGEGTFCDGTIIEGALCLNGQCVTFTPTPLAQGGCPCVDCCKYQLWMEDDQWQSSE